MDDQPTGEAPSLEQLDKEVEITVFQASGPGGQHRNRTYSAVRATHRPTGITVTASDTRSQLSNRKIAMKRLHERLVEHFRKPTPRRPTRKSRTVRKREKAERERLSERKRMRRLPDSETRGED